MDLHDAALVIAGIVGSTVAIVYGVLMQGLMVRPIHELTATQLPRTYRLRSWHAAIETEYSIHDRHAVGLKKTLGVYAPPPVELITSSVIQAASSELKG